MLFLRANPGDNGTRPVVGPFWESPDIYILGGVDASVAPDIPPELGQTAVAGKPNTVYAHVWNFGRSAARDVIVDFFWLNPSLAVGPTAIHRIGQTTVSLERRDRQGSHAIVKCPTSWNATYENGGHECLLVRAWTLTDDRLGSPEWDASLNRHIGQRNIHVMSAAEAAGSPVLPLQVGPLFGQPATVRVERATPTDVPWLQLRTGQRGVFPAPAAANGTVGLTPPATTGSDAGMGAVAAAHTVTGDNQQVGFNATDGAPGAGEAHVYRVTADQGGQLIGGFTVIVQG